MAEVSTATSSLLDETIKAVIYLETEVVSKVIPVETAPIFDPLILAYQDGNAVDDGTKEVSTSTIIAVDVVKVIGVISKVTNSAKVGVRNTRENPIVTEAKREDHARVVAVAISDVDLTVSSGVTGTPEPITLLRTTEDDSVPGAPVTGVLKVVSEIRISGAEKVDEEPFMASAGTIS